MNKKGRFKIISFSTVLMICQLYGCSPKTCSEAVSQISQGTGQETGSVNETNEMSRVEENRQEKPVFKIETIPRYEGNPSVEINGNTPFFTEEEKCSVEPFERYSDLDALGRCGVAYANVCQELMPTEERGEIGMVKPSGWHSVKYPELIEDVFLFNRCHLIGYQMTGENANEKNLITGTRYMNTEGMQPYEDKLAGYVRETGNHVLYRVTPIFEGDNLVASGVEMEAWSVEDNGAGVCFHIYCYNVQPGIEIDYATGDSHAAGSDGKEPKVTEPAAQENEPEKVLVDETEVQDFVLNENTK